MKKINKNIHSKFALWTLNSFFSKHFVHVDMMTQNVFNIVIRFFFNLMGPGSGNKNFLESIFLTFNYSSEKNCSVILFGEYFPILFHVDMIT